MKLILMADGDVGRFVYAYIKKRFPRDIAMVVTVKNSPIYTESLSDGFVSTVFVSEKALLSDLRRHEPPNGFDLGLSAWWPKIISKPVIGFPKKGFINFHPSLLPYNRGKHYNFWALVEQSPFGVSLNFIDDGIDTGDILAQRKIAYDWTDTGRSLYKKAQQEIQSLFCGIYPKIRRGEIERVSQDLSKGSFHFAKELDPTSRIYLDKTYKARDILNLIRARTFPGYPACYFYEKEQKYEARIEIKKV